MDVYCSNSTAAKSNTEAPVRIFTNFWYMLALPRPVSGATRLTERSKKRRENKINDKRKTRDASHRSKHYYCVYISSKHLGRKACGAMRDFYSV